MCVCGTCVNRASTKRKIICLVVSVCQVMSSQVCYILFSVSMGFPGLQQERLRARAFWEDEKKLPPKNIKHIKNGRNFQKAMFLPLLQHVRYVSSRKPPMCAWRSCLWLESFDCIVTVLTCFAQIQWASGESGTAFQVTQVTKVEGRSTVLYFQLHYHSGGNPRVRQLRFMTQRYSQSEFRFNRWDAASKPQYKARISR